MLLEYSESWDLTETELRTRILDNQIFTATEHSKKLHALLEHKKAEQRERIRAAGQ